MLGRPVVNTKLVFKRREPGHDDECCVCERTRLGADAVAIEHGPREPKHFASVYCLECVDALHKARTP